jgi:predicted RNase H-like nuclease (RuvC/YqgF family)
MAKVKIQTALASNFGHIISFGNLELHFDKMGFAEVDTKEMAEQLVKNYPNWLFIGEKPKNETKLFDNKEAIDLQNEIGRLKEKLIDREASIKAVEKENEEWKKELEKMKVIAQEATEELKGYKIQKDKEIKELELKVQLTSKNLKDLVDICISLEIPEERYKGKKKEDIIIIILDESRGK